MPLVVNDSFNSVLPVTCLSLDTFAVGGQERAVNFLFLNVREMATRVHATTSLDVLPAVCALGSRELGESRPLRKTRAGRHWFCLFEWRVQKGYAGSLWSVRLFRAHADDTTDLQWTEGGPDPHALRSCAWSSAAASVASSMRPVMATRYGCGACRSCTATQTMGKSNSRPKYFPFSGSLCLRAAAAPQQGRAVPVCCIITFM